VGSRSHRADAGIGSRGIAALRGLAHPRSDGFARAWPHAGLWCHNYAEFLDNPATGRYGLLVNPGSHIGQYRILRKLGGGGMGMVFLAEHLLLDRPAAIKTLLPTLSQYPEIVERFFNEARATSAIHDPGVVQIFDFGYHVDGTAYIVMEVLEGESLADRLERLGTLPVGDALRVARQVASSLATAHACGIVHRDLKPDNIFLVHDSESRGGERTKILDFGICKLGRLPEDPSITAEDTMLGTPVYMAPEQCKGAAHADHRSDIYALGCVLFHMIVGRPPFECDGIGEYIAAHLHDDPPAPSSLVDGLPDVIDELVLRCMAKDPDERFQSMKALSTAFEQTSAHLDTGVARLVATPSHLPLAKGFRSDYNGNQDTMVRHMPTPVPEAEQTCIDPPDQIAPLRWRFLTPRPTPNSVDVPLVPPRNTWRRPALGIAFAVALVLGGTAAYDSMTDDSIASPHAATLPAVAAPAPAHEPTPAPPPAPSIADTAATSSTELPPLDPPDPPESKAPVTMTIEAPKDLDAPPAPVPRTVAKPARPNVRRAPPPRPAPVTNSTPAPTTSTEDLYETR
jgi:serine/threonine protein kinase